ncbi:hypothetical protein AV540_20575 [Brevibacillus parabrevis]|nr:hypothetical protein AV540_20575 [Brevibacillus parabrevis]
MRFPPSLLLHKKTQLTPVRSNRCMTKERGVPVSCQKLRNMRQAQAGSVCYRKKSCGIFPRRQPAVSTAYLFVSSIISKTLSRFHRNLPNFFATSC